MKGAASGSLILIALLNSGVAAKEEPGMTASVAEAMQLAPVARNGAALYSEHCARCHGAEAWGNGPAGTPSLAGQGEKYLVTKLAQYAARERVHSQMHRVILLLQPLLGEPQAWRDIAAHLSSAEPNPRVEHGDGRALDAGRRLYAESCARCHEPVSRQREELPAIRGQHYSYLALQLRNFAIAHPADADAAMAALAKKLTSGQANAVADYLSRQPGPLAR